MKFQLVMLLLLLILLYNKDFFKLHFKYNYNLLSLLAWEGAYREVHFSLNVTKFTTFNL